MLEKRPIDKEKLLIILRKRTKAFNSIENVFDAIISSSNLIRKELPFESKGLVNRVRNIWFLMKQKANIIHISGHDHYLLWWPFKKTVLTIHDIESLKRKKGLKKWLFRLFWFDIPIMNAQIITTISEFSKREILSIRNYTTPIVVVHNPLTLPLKYIPKEFSSSKPRILHIGVKENKNLNRLVEALAGISCKLVIIGDASDAVVDKMKDLNVDFEVKEALSKEELMQEYVACDIMAFVSTYEGFGLPIIEAQAVGRPIITSNNTSIPEVAGSAALMVDPFNVNEIREGVLELIRDKELRDSLVKQGLENVKRFDVKAVSEKYNSIYKELA